MKTQKANKEDVFSQKQAARHAGISVPTLRRHLSEIAHRKLDKRVLITRSALERWLEGHKEGAAK